MTTLVRFVQEPCLVRQLLRAVPDLRFLSGTLEVMPDPRFHLIGLTMKGVDLARLAGSGVLVSLLLLSEP